MTTVAAGNSAPIDLAATDAYRVSVPDGGEAYVDLLSGAPGSPYASVRIIGQTSGKVFGPYGVPAHIVVRATVGTATIDPYADPVPVMQDPDGSVHATIIPRTNTLTNLKALMTGGGELASATDTPCIVQLNGTPGSGTAAVYSPMAPGSWSDSVGVGGHQQLQAKAGTGVNGQAGNGRNLLLTGGAGSTTGTNKTGGGVVISGGIGGVGGASCGIAVLQPAGPSGVAGLADSTSYPVFYVDGATSLLMVENLPEADPHQQFAIYLHDVGGGVLVMAVSQG